MTLLEASLHLGFLIEELKLSLDEKELAELGLGISPKEKEGSQLWGVVVRRPLNRTITFSVLPSESEGWGADFKVLDGPGAQLLGLGYVEYLLTYFTWLLELRTNDEESGEARETEEFNWQA